MGTIEVNLHTIIGRDKWGGDTPVQKELVPSQSEFEIALEPMIENKRSDFYSSFGYSIHSD